MPLPGEDGVPAGSIRSLPKFNHRPDKPTGVCQSPYLQERHPRVLQGLRLSLFRLILLQLIELRFICKGHMPFDQAIVQRVAHSNFQITE